MKKDNTEEEMKKAGFGTNLEERLTATLPGVGPKTLPYGYTSEAEIRERVMAILKITPPKLSKRQMEITGIGDDPLLHDRFTKQRTLSEEERLKIAEGWIERHIQYARKQARLMTDQQLSDWRLGRKLSVGDRARYIGPDRNEVTQAYIIVPRMHGQIGVITNAQESRDTRVLTFHPHDAVAPIEAPGVDKQFVDLQVREHTQGFLHLERLPL